MKVHHLNCGTMHPPGTSLVCHVLLIETAKGLALVDTGFGTADIANPARRVGPARFFTRPAFDPAETATAQVVALGFDPHDVRDIVITHFDADHIGGLSDFPHARVHTTSAEVLAAITKPDWRERRRYRPAQWSHGPRIVEHEPVGELWRGFAAAKALDEIDPGIALVALPGHTRGHAAVAVDAGDRWLLHAGDAFYHPSTVGDAGKSPWSLRLMEAIVATVPKQVRANHERLTELRGRHDPDLLVLCAHDPSLFNLTKPTEPTEPTER